MKGKGEKERYTHLNAEFQRIAKRGNKAFLSDQCKEIEENNRMGKTRHLFKKIGDTKGTFHAKMDTIKDRNGMDLQKQKILRRGGKSTQKVKVKSLSCVRLFVTWWTVACQSPANVGNLISGFSAFSKTSLNIWKFMVHALLKPGLENFEHNLASI